MRIINSVNEKLKTHQKAIFAICKEFCNTKIRIFAN